MTETYLRNMIEGEAQRRGFNVNTKAYTDDGEVVIQVWTYVDGDKYAFEVSYNPDAVSTQIKQGEFFPRSDGGEDVMERVNGQLDHISALIIDRATSTSHRE